MRPSVRNLRPVLSAVIAAIIIAGCGKHASQRTGESAPTTPASPTPSSPPAAEVPQDRAIDRYLKLQMGFERSADPVVFVRADHDEESGEASGADEGPARARGRCRVPCVGDATLPEVWQPSVLDLELDQRSESGPAGPWFFTLAAFDNGLEVAGATVGHQMIASDERVMFASPRMNLSRTADRSGWVIPLGELLTGHEFVVEAGQTQRFDVTVTLSDGRTQSQTLLVRMIGHVAALKFGNLLAAERSLDSADESRRWAADGKLVWRQYVTNPNARPVDAVLRIRQRAGESRVVLRRTAHAYGDTERDRLVTRESDVYGSIGTDLVVFRARVRLIATEAPNLPGAPIDHETDAGDVPLSLGARQRALIEWFAAAPSVSTACATPGPVPERIFWERTRTRCNHGECNDHTESVYTDFASAWQPVGAKYSVGLRFDAETVAGGAGIVPGAFDGRWPREWIGDDLALQAGTYHDDQVAGVLCRGSYL